MFLVCIVSLKTTLAQNGYQINQIVLNDARLVSAIEDYSIEWNDVLENKGVVVVLCDFSTGRYYVTYKMYASEVVERPPLFFTVVKDMTVLIYTGFESKVKLDKDALKAVLNSAKGRLDSDPANGYYDPVFWEITLTGNGYSKKELYELPMIYKK